MDTAITLEYLEANALPLDKLEGYDDDAIPSMGLKVYEFSGQIYVICDNGEIMTKLDFDELMDVYYKEYDIIYVCTPDGPKSMILKDYRQNEEYQKLNPDYFYSFNEAEKWCSRRKSKAQKSGRKG